MKHDHKLSQKAIELATGPRFSQQMLLMYYKSELDPLTHSEIEEALETDSEVENSLFQAVLKEFEKDLGSVLKEKIIDVAECISEEIPFSSCDNEAISFLHKALDVEVKNAASSSTYEPIITLGDFSLQFEDVNQKEISLIINNQVFSEKEIIINFLGETIGGRIESIGLFHSRVSFPWDDDFSNKIKSTIRSGNHESKISFEIK